MLNHIEIMGNLVADPEVKATSNGIKVCSFRIACERDYAAYGAQKETDFIDIVAWREKAEFVGKYFSKGMPILVSGRLQIRKWEDRDGNKRSTAEVQADNLYFAGGERKQEKQTAAPAWKKKEAGTYDEMWNEDEGDLPF